PPPPSPSACRAVRPPIPRDPPRPWPYRHSRSSPLPARCSARRPPAELGPPESAASPVCYSHLRTPSAGAPALLGLPETRLCRVPTFSVLVAVLAAIPPASTM